MNQPPPKYIISAAEAESMARSRGLTVPQLLPSLVEPAQRLARPPISHFAVGVAGLTSDGRIFTGGNVEFPGLPLHHTIHGEQFFITNVAAHSSACKLLYVAVSATPCGHCRQFFQELRGISDTQIVITDQPLINPRYKPFSSLLPHAFNLLDQDSNTPLILEQHNNQLSFKHNDGDDGVDLLASEAMEAARGSHAPYSGCPSGVALMDSEGGVYKGSYMESAAYNPSMMPVQAAVVAYMVAGGGGFERITAAVLVEKEAVVVRQEETVRLLLKHISPQCELRVVHCH